MDIQYLMRQARKLEKAMADAKEKLAEIGVEAESGGGLVKVAMNGRCEITRLTIDPRALEPFCVAAPGVAGQPPPQPGVDPNERALLEDLVTAAVNSAAEKARAAADDAMQKATGGIRIPGITG